ncbi:unnamed protein product [Ambrosiozyma monospora]|uniref:Unnamed protein product n=1 Tax=Ambrosiozyma monospora TaxID=43982 RepID=A0ACB5TBW0_AMBMO|nr:unnamed protein product [Ambrosiozyma monospora]
MSSLAHAPPSVPPPEPERPVPVADFFNYLLMSETDAMNLEVTNDDAIERDFEIDAFFHELDYHDIYPRVSGFTLLNDFPDMVLFTTERQ